MEQTIEVIGFPMDLGADRRGVDMGPSAIRIAGLEEKLQELGYDVIDHGDVLITHRANQKIANPKLKYLDEIIKASQTLGEGVEQVLERGNFPLCLGGDHSMALGTIAGVASHCRKHNKSFGIIWIDAHSDMNTEETTPSGNIHGMPLSASLGIGNPDLANIMGFTPKVKPENCALVGIRSIDALERENIKKVGLPVYTMHEIDKHGAYTVIKEILKQFHNKLDHVHVSFDVDVVDPNEAPGVGTPVPGGLSYRESHLIMETIAEFGCMSSLEVVEVNPIIDSKNKSAEFTVDLVASSMGQRII